MKKAVLFLAITGVVFGQAWPNRAATNSDLLVASDNATSRLGSGMDSSTLTVTLSQAGTFVANSVITIDNEQIKICSVSGTTLTACVGGRGFAGTTAASHTVNALVSNSVSATYHNTLAAEQIALESDISTNGVKSAWGKITGTISNQTDLNSALAAKQSTLTLPLSVANGGTGTSSPALVAGQNISISGTWPNQTITGTGAGSSTPAGSSGSVQYNNSGALGGLSLGSSSQVLHGNAGGAPTWGATSLVTDVSGVLPISNGGTGTTTPGLVQGSNVTITGNWPNQTIAATGGAGSSFYQTLLDNNGNPVTQRAKLKIANGSNITSTVWADNGTDTSTLTINAAGGSGTVSVGPLASLPGTCTAGALYFATDQPAGQQLYECSATNTWTQFLSLGASGALAFTGGALDIATSVVPRLSAANHFTGSNTLDGTTTLNNVAINGTCTGCTAGLSNPMTTQGDLIVGGTSGAATRLAAGTATYVLTSNGAGATPSWQASTGAGSGTTIQTGTTSSLPSTCTTGALYFATDQFPGQQLYQCSSANTWTQTLSLGTSGGLAMTAGALDINTAVVPTKAAANTFSGSNTFGGTTSLNNVVISGTCTGSGCGGSSSSGSSGYLYGATVSGACSSSDSIQLDSFTISGGTLSTHNILAIESMIQTTGTINQNTGNQYIQFQFGTTGFYPSANVNAYQLPNGTAFATQNETFFVTSATSELPYGMTQFLNNNFNPQQVPTTNAGNTPAPRYSAPSTSSYGTNTEAGVATENIANPITVHVYLKGCSSGGGGTVQVSWHLSLR